MYAVSFGLVVVALITLIVGVFQSGLTFIWVSIGSSVGAAVFLALGVLQKRPVAATAGAPFGAAGGTATAVETAPEPPMASPIEPLADDTEVVEAEAPAPARAASRRVTATATRGGARKATATRATATAKRATSKAVPARTAAQVVAIPERGTFHVASCRFVKGRRDTEKMNKATASRRGYTPCGICRP